jgi:hypothetical protein
MTRRHDPNDERAEMQIPVEDVGEVTVTYRAYGDELAIATSAGEMDSLPVSLKNTILNAVMSDIMNRRTAKLK